MRKAFVISLIFTLFFTSTYWYYSSASLCRYPISYRIGELDERFALTEAEARVAIHDAASIWEEGTGKHLFRHDEDAWFTINFIFDDRQALSEEERELHDELVRTQTENVAIAEQYATLVAQYNDLKISYQREVERYERDLSRYNARVAEYNQAGGAPEDVVEELDAEQARLQAEAQRLDEQAQLLNDLTGEINRVGQEGNRLVEAYNEAVAQYNARFGGGREFTQGEYRGDSITIYTFKDELELRQVLAHELGHALALEHVNDPRAIMYFLMGTQPDELKLKSADLEEFDRVCGAGPGARGWLYQQFVRLESVL